MHRARFNLRNGCEVAKVIASVTNSDSPRIGYLSFMPLFCGLISMKSTI